MNWPVNIIPITDRSNTGCSEPGHRVHVAIPASRGPGRWVVRCLHKLVRKSLIISLLVVAVMAVFVALPHAPPQTVSTLPREDVTQITRVVCREMRREVLPDMSLYSISQLPSSLRRYWSEQIKSIYAEDDGTVSVMTGRKKNGVWYFHASAFRLKRGPKGWVITSRSSWISSSDEAPNTSRACVKTPEARF